ncbi:Calx-beta domain-containing protein [Flavobacterium sp.]|uniref:DUF7619 domain-containing protein n=1 Tax=Flavobacterium sp. TaxID=239 RepID=UPI00261BA711|nr:Calx-beta domain-containing protein [Flavobacterium sp.]
MKKHFWVSFWIFLLGVFFTTASAQDQSFYISNGGSGYNVLEGSSYTFSVNLYNAHTTAVVINVNTAIGTAESTDFTALSTTVTIAAGTLSSGPLTIATTNDADIEPSFENFIIKGTAISGDTSNTVYNSYVYIVDNDKAPAISINNRTIVEGQGANMTITLSNPFHSNVVLTCLTATGTANASDFTAISNTVTIAAGQTTSSFNVFTTSDAITEPDENFTINITATSANTENASTLSTITIRDNDTTPTLTLSDDPYTIEGQTIYTSAVLDRPFNSDVVIQLTTTTGTAGSTDFTAINTTKTIVAGSVYVSFQINVTEDLLDEPNESFTVTGTVTSANTTNPSATATMTVIDNDGLPDFEIYYGYDVEPVEGDDAYIGIGLTNPSATPTTVQITTANGTAGSLDYTPLTTTVTIPAGQTYSETGLIVPTLLDQLQEGSETFIVNGVVTSGNTYNTNASLTVTISDNYNINAQTDTITSVAEVGTTYSLLANDTLHGAPLNAADASVTLLGSNTIGATLDAQGNLTIPASAPIGSYYQLSYRICETANPGSCDTTTFNVNVVSPLKVTYDLSYSDYNGDGFTSVGDLIHYQFTVANIGNAPLTSIQVYQNYSQLTITGSAIANLNAGQSDTTTFSAIHILTQDDINYGRFNGTPPQGFELFFKGTYYGYQVTGMARQQNTFTLNSSDGIRVKAFVDTNANGVQDNSEVNFPLGQFKYEINQDGVVHNLYSTPFYIYESNPTTTYSLSYVVNPDYAANNSCPVSYPNITVAPGSGITTYNFPITVTPYQELSINLIGPNPPPRPGFNYYQYLKYTNNSNETVASGTVTFTKDSAVNITNISESTATLTATGFTYNFTNLLPYQTRYIYVRLQVPNIPTVSIGQLVTNTASVNLPVNDIFPLNNTSSVTQTIVGSYDPNDKTEAHGGQIVHSNFTAADYLTYTIQFENTGTANAINIRVEDFLDSKLDSSSIKMVDASAAYSLERIENHLIWNFSAIDLPPSIADTTTGKGYLTFQVKPKSGFALGDIIPNTAEIYFDFNPAIVTNTCTTEFVPFLGVNVFENDALEYHPNPTSGIITFDLKKTNIDNVEVTDVLGKTLISKTIHYNNAAVDLSSLEKGLYLIRLQANGQSKTVKITKN